MIARIVLAVVVAVAVGLGLTLLGVVLAALSVPIATTVGAFLERWAWVIGVLAGIWFYFSGSTWGAGWFRRPAARP